jgi:cephalosporin hydroxylase
VIQTINVVDAFHVTAYDAAKDGGSWGGATYFGQKIWKWPCDLQLYQELVYELKPRIIIETGTAFGGSALYFAHLLDQLGTGKVVSVDLNEVQQNYPKHARIAYIGGKSSTHPEVLREVESHFHCYCEPRATRKAQSLVILDSDHAKTHVLGELNAYNRFVTDGGYLVVEDVNVNGHPVYAEHGPGPREALDLWMPKNEAFKTDEQRASKYLFSMHAWLRRRRI